MPTGDAAEVGGDFYDVVPLADDRWLVVVGDVSGKGVQAAAVTGLVRDVIRVLVGDGRPLAGDARPGSTTRWSSAAAAGSARWRWPRSARRRTATLDVSLHLAGHDRPVLVRADGSASFVGTGGTALGLLDTIASPVADGHAAAR